MRCHNFCMLTRQKYAPTLRNAHVFLYICDISEVVNYISQHILLPILERIMVRFYNL